MKKSIFILSSVLLSTSILAACGDSKGEMSEKEIKTAIEDWGTPNGFKIKDSFKKGTTLVAKSGTNIFDKKNELIKETKLKDDEIKFLEKALKSAKKIKIDPEKEEKELKKKYKKMISVNVFNNKEEEGSYLVFVPENKKDDILAYDLTEVLFGGELKLYKLNPAFYQEFDERYISKIPKEKLEKSDKGGGVNFQMKLDSKVDFSQATFTDADGNVQEIKEAEKKENLEFDFNNIGKITINANKDVQVDGESIASQTTQDIVIEGQTKDKAIKILKEAKGTEKDEDDIEKVTRASEKLDYKVLTINVFFKGNENATFGDESIEIFLPVKESDPLYLEHRFEYLETNKTNVSAVKELLDFIKKSN